MTALFSTNDLHRKILPLREQAAVRNRWLQQRLETVLPEIMARESFDMWLVSAREYNEDPVIMTLLPEPTMNARRRTILVFTRLPDASVERLSIDRYGFGDFYQSAWNPDREQQYECLRRIIDERQPQTIGINISEHFAFGDGLTHTEYDQLFAIFDTDFMRRMVSAERLCIGWLERRIPAELTAYPALVEIGHALISQAFSNRVIHPGITTTDDIVWWFRQRMHDLGLRAWFQPTVELQASGQPYNYPGEKRTLILPGDLLHCDVGFYYLGLATDQQQHAYILKPDETHAPDGLRAALTEANRLQDIHLQEMIPGKTGNEILHAVLKKAKAEGLNPQVYSHAIGYHGHAAGPTIGLWDQQDSVEGKGDYKLFDHTCHSIELNIKKPLPEWDGQEIRIALEEDAVLTDGQIRWLNGRQTQFHLIG